MYNCLWINANFWAVPSARLEELMRLYFFTLFTTVEGRGSDLPRNLSATLKRPGISFHVFRGWPRKIGKMFIEIIRIGVGRSNVKG